jgi:hypothetical protein
MDWSTLHERVVAAGKRRIQGEHEVGRLLLQVRSARIWEHFGQSGIFEYAERTLGLTPRQTEERLRVASALTWLPASDAALASGRVHWSAVKEYSRIARPETEAAWADAAEKTTVGQIQRMVAERDVGDLPTDPPRRTVRRRRLVIDVSAEIYATWREAVGKLRRESGGPLSEEDAVQLMARAVLGGPRDEGRSSYQIHMTVCEQCGAADQEGRGVAVPVGAEIAEMAACDAQVVKQGRATQDVTPAVRRECVRRQQGRCAVPGCRNATFCDLHHLQMRQDGGGHDADNLVVLCSAHHAAVHRGTLSIEGSWSRGLVFRHADGSPYGEIRGPHGGAESLREALEFIDLPQQMTG